MTPKLDGIIRRLCIKIYHEHTCGSLKENFSSLNLAIYKMITHYGYERYIPEMQSYSNIWKSIDVIQDFNRLTKKNYAITHLNRTRKSIWLRSTLIHSNTFLIN